MKLIKYTIFLLIPITISCSKDESLDLNVDCGLFKVGLININKEVVGTEISKLTDDLKPKPTSDDVYGHIKNFNLLIERINQCNNISAESAGYCGIETYPPQSEILIRVSSDEQQFQRIIDILTSKDKNLEYLGIHE